MQLKKRLIHKLYCYSTKYIFGFTGILSDILLYATISAEISKKYLEIYFITLIFIS